MEFFFMKHLFEDKEIVNPLNPEEVFSCSDLSEDFKICRREKRLQTATAGKRMHCHEYRRLGKSKSSRFLCVSHSSRLRHPSQQVLLSRRGRICGLRHGKVSREAPLRRLFGARGLHLGGVLEGKPRRFPAENNLESVSFNV